MADTDLKKIVIFGDPKKGSVKETIEDFLNFAKGKVSIIGNCHINDCTTDVLSDADYAVVFGGDGSIISAVRNLSQMDVPVIGVNLGKLGFLAEFSVEELKEHFDKIIGGKAKIERRMMLRCKVIGDKQTRFQAKAVNDIFVMAGPPFRMIEFKIVIDGEKVADCVSDGLIISTPTGSTAYNLSAGGPILSGKMQAVVITPVCPHSLSFRPIVIDSQSRIEIIGTQLNEGSEVSVDGQVAARLKQADVVRIDKADSSFLILNNPLRNEWQTLATKLNWAEKPRYKNN